MGLTNCDLDHIVIMLLIFFTSIAVVFAEDTPVPCRLPIEFDTTYSYNVITSVDSGEKCMNWKDAPAEQYRHALRITGGTNHNSCRNPDGDARGIWCFSTSTHQKEYCLPPYYLKLPICTEEMAEAMKNAAEGGDNKSFFGGCVYIYDMFKQIFIRAKTSVRKFANQHYKK